ncbi:28 kDa inner dynein arm light chain, axonemal [Toxocara canis]|uniref:28 kDa inner dynein arm light chain, axonemal n=1 Tax=Toxocara canis TaxID=6265 RepID=A0A0B2VXA9_TOXCA|nr:28 kDa inner dynein arm light chain, axonemal [Toxocara canis]
MSPVEEDRGLLRRSQREEVSEGDGCEDIPDFESLAESPLPPIDPEVQLQNIIDCILPPRVYESEGKIWRERTSTVPATRHDVAETQERFELELRNRKAKPFGICPIRRDIYDQLFDELIRQVSVNCAERGLMLLRVRDELRLTLFSYEHVLESAIAYGIRKSITTQQQQTTAVVERDRLHEQNKQLLAKITELERDLQNERRLNEEELHLLEERMNDENERLKEANKALKHQLTTLLQMDEEFRMEHKSLN